MLHTLYVKNLALIEEAEVAFSPGLNIMTGETGAGKSIIIGSIGLALGEKAPKEMIRKNAPYGLVELTFSVEDRAIEKKLEEMDIFLEDGFLTLSRKIVNGRNISKINAETVPAARAKEVAGLLIDIHGQHQHQSLLVKKNHINILDSYAKSRLKKEKEALKAAYEAYKKVKSKLQEASLDTSDREREISFLSYEVEEIEKAGLTCGEDEELEREYKRLSNGQKILEAISGAYAKTGEGLDSATEQIGRAVKELSAVSEYEEYITDASFDEETFAMTERRLDEINRLKAKYGRTIEEVLDSLSEKKERLGMLSDYDAYLERLQKEFSECEADVEMHAARVSKIRKEAARELSESIQKELKDLNFLEVSFAMEIRKMDHYTANGYDDAQFLISTNPGEPMQSLEKIASGGLGQSHQIICITHLPQIAAMADGHYLIEKSVSGEATISTIRALEEAESVKELARMLGGVKITDTVLKSAKEMKELAANTKKTLGEPK